MKLRPALLLCLLLSLGLSSADLNAQGNHIVPVPGTLFPITYQGRVGKYTVVATFETNETISAYLLPNSRIITLDEPITGVGTNMADRLVYISFGESGYLEGRVNRSGTKIRARAVLRIADKGIKRRCVLKWHAGEPGSHGVVITYMPTPPISVPASPGATNFIGLAREEAEAAIELARRALQEQTNPTARILAPTSLGRTLPGSFPTIPAPAVPALPAP
jgi:hypothetical protein